jgi:hypothetical protein
MQLTWRTIGHYGKAGVFIAVGTAIGFVAINVVNRITAAVRR